MFEGDGWEVLSKLLDHRIRVNARKVDGFQEFDYQVTSKVRSEDYHPIFIPR